MCKSKQNLFILTFLFLFLTLFLLTPQSARAYMLYENPQRIIISAPANNYKTSSEQVSILGACDWTQPLYLNGQPLEYTEHGFFSVYVNLQIGENTFTFSQGEQTRSITINRTGGGSGSSGSTGGGFSWDNVKFYENSRWGTVKSNNITHRAQADKSQNLLNALAKGTTSRIIGEYGDYYCLADRTFIYKNNVSLLATENEPSGNRITSLTITPRTAQNCTEVNFKADVNALYKTEIDQNQVRFTLYDSSNACQPVYADNPLFSDIQVQSAGENAVQYIFNLKSGAMVNGYYVEFRDGFIVLGLKQPPVLANAAAGDLTGAVILLDAGHGGNDGGASGPPASAGPLEKNINLVITNYAKDYLESRGATVIMTRTDDTESSLAARVSQILEHKPDLAISIHSNSIAETADYGNIRGLRSYYTYPGAYNAASFITERVSQYTALNQTKPQISNLALTRIENTPALLIENAFISNPADYEMMIQSDYQQKFGEAVGRAATEYILTLAAGNTADSFAVSTMGQAVSSDPANRPITVYLDGQPLQFDVQPIIQNNATLVPLRVIFEALDAQVVWNNETKDLTANKPAADIRLYLALNSQELQITEAGQTRTATLATPATIVDGRVLVPLRAISEGFGCSVSWEAAERSVVIRTIED